MTWPNKKIYFVCTVKKTCKWKSEQYGGDSQLSEQCFKSGEGYWVRW